MSFSLLVFKLTAEYYRTDEEVENENKRSNTSKRKIILSFKIIN